ncbi:hypothetical protein EDB85DRAFT_1896648 [Lactarius pseudohatsudake]|nr:hypothetical protein EDB85DRAFT_1896648 [Lactarius pseudohatsudake]
MASRTAHNGINPAAHVPVPKASKQDSPHCDFMTVVGGGQPKVVRGRWWRRHGECSRGLQPGDEERSQDVVIGHGNGATELTSTTTERVYRASLHGQDLMKDSLPLLSYPTFLFSDPTLGAKSGLTVTRRRVLMVAHYGQQDWPQ